MPRSYIVNASETELDRFSTLKVTIPTDGAGLAAKILLKQALSNSAVNLAGHEEMRTRSQREAQAIRAAEDTFGAKVTNQLHQLADEIVGAKGAIILYDEMATLERQC